MAKRRKQDRKTSPREDAHSFGSGLDEVGWMPATESIRLKPRVEKTIDQVLMEFERALNAIAAERRFGGPDVLSAELEMLEEATKLVKRL